MLKCWRGYCAYAYGVAVFQTITRQHVLYTVYGVHVYSTQENKALSYELKLTDAFTSGIFWEHFRSMYPHWYTEYI